MTNRRQFLTGALGGAVAGMSMPSAFAAQANSALPSKWDMTADVVVLGYGGAGATTAIVAAQNGASVIVLEKNPADAHISNTRMSAAFSTARSRTAIRRLSRNTPRRCSPAKTSNGRKRAKSPSIPTVWLSSGPIFLRRTWNSCRVWTPNSSAAASRLRQGFLPELPGRQGMPLQRLSCDLHEAHEEFQSGFLQVPEE